MLRKGSCDLCMRVVVLSCKIQESLVGKRLFTDLPT